MRELHSLVMRQVNCDEFLALKEAPDDPYQDRSSFLDAYFPDSMFVGLAALRAGRGDPGKVKTSEVANL